MKKTARQKATRRRHTDFKILAPVPCLEVVKKERKKTDNPREGWEDGTPPPHRDLRRGFVVL